MSKLKLVGHDWGKIVHTNPAPLTKPPGPKLQFGTTTVPNFPRPFSVQEDKPPIASLQENLARLNTLHAKLKRMLTELEDLVK